MSTRIFTLTMNKIFIWGPKIMRKVAMILIWICESSRTKPIACLICYEKWVQREKCPITLASGKACNSDECWHTISNRNMSTKSSKSCMQFNGNDDDVVACRSRAQIYRGWKYLWTIKRQEKLKSLREQAVIWRRYTIFEALNSPTTSEGATLNNMIFSVSVYVWQISFNVKLKVQSVLWHFQKQK